MDEHLSGGALHRSAALSAGERGVHPSAPGCPRGFYDEEASMLVLKADKCAPSFSCSWSKMKPQRHETKKHTYGCPEKHEVLMLVLKADKYKHVHLNKVNDLEMMQY